MASCLIRHLPLVILCAVSTTKAQLDSLSKTNFLFILFDDLRPELNAYGRKHMITPNFDRLAAKSVIFDKAYCQIAVCNPSRDALLTGLRPDTTGTYAFQSSFRPHVTIQSHLVDAGYYTAGYGKVNHWEEADAEQWSYEQWPPQANWYKYQMDERDLMNATTQPDRLKKEEDFRDHQIATKAIEGLRRLATDKNDKHFMVAAGFKLPHLAMHVPWQDYEVYTDQDRMAGWALTKKERKFPSSAPPVAYRCCAMPKFRYMVAEGQEMSRKTVELGSINMRFSESMRNELMQGYCAGVTFADRQLGRILDAIDELQLWNNLTIVLSADHGIHNGEKGMWGKWSLFDESTRVPLMIYHPQSPYKGKHYSHPVELIDIYPTVLDLVQVDGDREQVCRKGHLCRRLQGKSRAALVLGKSLPPHLAKSAEYSEPRSADSKDTVVSLQSSPDDVAISQTWRCSHAEREQEAKDTAMNGLDRRKGKTLKQMRYSNWKDCDKGVLGPNVQSVMGYSMRTDDFRYTAYFQWHKEKMVPKLDAPILEEELYDNRGETLEDFTHLELTNVANRGAFKNVTATLRRQLIAKIRETFLFRGPF